MKKTALILLFIALAAACGRRQVYPPMAIEAEFPLILSEIDLDDERNTIPLDKNAAARIDALIKEFAASIASVSAVQDAQHRDTYIAALRMEDPSYTVYVVLLHYFPPMVENVCGKALFYDNRSGRFIDETFDLGIHNLYHFYDGKLVPTNLKTELGITAPEIAPTDPDGDGITDFEITTLLHNGTYNSEQRVVLTLKNSTVDTLSLRVRSPIGITGNE